MSILDYCGILLVSKITGEDGDLEILPRHSILIFCLLDIRYFKMFLTDGSLRRSNNQCTRQWQCTPWFSSFYPSQAILTLTTNSKCACFASQPTQSTSIVPILNMRKFEMVLTNDLPCYKAMCVCMYVYMYLSIYLSIYLSRVSI